jgi:hypothetical protein
LRDCDGGFRYRSTGPLRLLVIFKVTHSGHVGVQSEALLLLNKASLQHHVTKLRFELQRYAVTKLRFELQRYAVTKLRFELQRHARKTKMISIKKRCA